APTAVSTVRRVTTPATSEILPLSLHDALPISRRRARPGKDAGRAARRCGGAAPAGRGRAHPCDRAVGAEHRAPHGRHLRACAGARAVNGRAPIAVVALALVAAVLGGRFVVRTVQTARLGDARDFAILYTGAYLYRAGASFYDPGMDRVEGVNRNAALIAEARRLGTLHAHEGLVHIHAFSYPPFAVLPFLPFTALDWRSAVAAWMTLSLALVAAAFVGIVRAARLGVVAALTLAALFLVSEPLENSMGLGAINSLR